MSFEQTDLKKTIIGGSFFPTAEAAAITIVFTQSAPGLTLKHKNKSLKLNKTKWIIHFNKTLSSNNEGLVHKWTI